MWTNGPWVEEMNSIKLCDEAAQYKTKKCTTDAVPSFTHLFAYRHPTAQSKSQTQDFSNKSLES